MLRISRLVGLMAGVGVISLWGVFGLLNLYGYQSLSGSVYLVVGLMVCLAIVGLFAALTDNPYLMLAVFGFSFVPVGLYLLGTPGILRWIGGFNILFLLSALLNFLGRRERSIGLNL